MDSRDLDIGPSFWGPPFSPLWSALCPPNIHICPACKTHSPVPTSPNFPIHCCSESSLTSPPNITGLKVSTPSTHSPGLSVGDTGCGASWGTSPLRVWTSEPGKSVTASRAHGGRCPHYPSETVSFQKGEGEGMKRSSVPGKLEAHQGKCHQGPRPENSVVPHYLWFPFLPFHLQSPGVWEQVILLLSESDDQVSGSSRWGTAPRTPFRPSVPSRGHSTAHIITARVSTAQ